MKRRPRFHRVSLPINDPNYFFAAFFAFHFAHLALAAAAIRALPAALIFRLFFRTWAAPGLAVEPNIRLNLFSKATILSLRDAARRSSFGVR
jgi:hypothetical protein